MIVLLLAHPIRLLFGLGEHDEVIAYTELLTFSEVGAALARTVLFKQPIDATAHQLAEQKIRRVKGISEQDVIALERIEHRTQQRLFVATLALAGTRGGVEQRTAAQAQQGDHTTYWKAQARFLTARLRIGGLIVRRVGQCYRGAVYQTHLTALPVPPGGATLCDHCSGLQRQGGNHRQRQTRPRLAVSPRVGLARFHTAYKYV